VASRHLLLVRGHQVLAVLLVVLPAHQVRARGLAQQGQQACLQDRQVSSSSSRVRLLVRPLGVTSRLALLDRS
jgi:BarA-like signal transduction histidine kinase